MCQTTQGINFRLLGRSAVLSGLVMLTSADRALLGFVVMGLMRSLNFEALMLKLVYYKRFGQGQPIGFGLKSLSPGSLLFQSC